VIEFRAQGAIGLVTVGTLFSAMAVKLQLAFDTVFVAACTLAYPFTVED